MEAVLGFLVSLWEGVQSAPVLKPVVGLLYSRKFLVTVAAMVIDYLVLQAPELLEVREELVAVVTFFAVWLVGQIAREDVAKSEVAVSEVVAGFWREVRELEMRAGVKSEPVLDQEMARFRSGGG